MPYKRSKEQHEITARETRGLPQSEKPTMNKDFT